MEITLRKARYEDREKVINVESKSTPNLSYVHEMWDKFTSDKIGEFSVALIGGEIVGCGKYSILPDDSAWLETLRVIPERQGLGVGKKFYERFFERAKAHGVKTMRMYTGLQNVISKGLAERYGLRLAATYRGASCPCQPRRAHTGGFQQVKDVKRATELVMSFEEKWTGFLVMNRTFFKFTPDLCEYLVENGMVYEDPATDSVITLGARFMPERALHIGVLKGDYKACLDFALQKCAEVGARGLNCDFSPSATDIQEALTDYGFKLTPSDFIVLEIKMD